RRLRVDGAGERAGEREQGKAGEQGTHLYGSAGKIPQSLAGGARRAWATGHGCLRAPACARGALVGGFSREPFVPRGKLHAARQETKPAAEAAYAAPTKRRGFRSFANPAAAGAQYARRRSPCRGESLHVDGRLLPRLQFG